MVKFVSLAINTVMKPRQKRQNQYTRQRITTKNSMLEQRLSYRLNPLPHSQPPQPQRPTNPTPSDLPENLYRPPQTKVKQSFKPSQSVVQPAPGAQIRSSVISSRPAPDPARFQKSEPQTIARHILKDSDSARLEQLLRRQESKRYEPSQRQSPELEQLAVVRRLDGRYQIVLRFNQQPITHQVFRTLKHCSEAAAELEQRFELSIVADGATAEAIAGIVSAAVMRECVELECAVA